MSTSAPVEMRRGSKVADTLVHPDTIPGSRARRATGHRKTPVITEIANPALGLLDTSLAEVRESPHHAARGENSLAVETLAPAVAGEMKRRAALGSHERAATTTTVVRVAEWRISIAVGEVVAQAWHQEAATIDAITAGVPKRGAVAGNVKVMKDSEDPKSGRDVNKLRRLG